MGLYMVCLFVGVLLVFLTCCLQMIPYFLPSQRQGDKGNYGDFEIVCKASGQCINMEKSSVYFSNNTSLQHRDVIKALLGVHEVDRFESYLGLPTLVGRKKYHTFSFIKDRVWKKLQG